MIRLSAKMGFGLLGPKKPNALLEPEEVAPSPAGVIRRQDMESIVLSNSLGGQMKTAFEHRSNEVEINREETDFLELGRMLRLRSAQEQLRAHPALRDPDPEPTRLVLWTEVDMRFDAPEDGSESE